MLHKFQKSLLVFGKSWAWNVETWPIPPTTTKKKSMIHRIAFLPPHDPQPLDAFAMFSAGAANFFCVS